MVNFIWQLASFLFGFITVVFLLIVLITSIAAFIKTFIEGVIEALKKSRSNTAFYFVQAWKTLKAMDLIVRDDLKHRRCQYGRRKR
ncbi:hypothetical protein [Streptococcus gallolyticus]|uniref:hypothetical protein n=1 Tax=Streptococcus gallolyticus TaxID=315405 RepID=UPI002284D418|nr:hypothetical protein [Streptococcus gallolyticus]MCY7192562.1 hypothetical protein [Streptococcus gallolyticus subsp. gallolyticus]